MDKKTQIPTLSKTAVSGSATMKIEYGSHCFGDIVLESALIEPCT